MEQLVARRAHNPKVVGSSPAPATKKPFCFGVAFNFAFLRPRVMSPRANNSKGEAEVNDSPADCQSRRADRSIFSAEKMQDRWFKSSPRNQQCEPKKISVRKTQKPQRFLGFSCHFSRCNSKDIIPQKRPLGRTWTKFIGDGVSLRCINFQPFSYSRWVSSQNVF